MTLSLHQGGVVMSSQIKHTHSHQDTRHPLAHMLDSWALIFSTCALFTVYPNHIIPMLHSYNISTKIHKKNQPVINILITSIGSKQSPLSLWILVARRHTKNCFYVNIHICATKERLLQPFPLPDIGCRGRRGSFKYII